jgi:diguanylate cyclase (GGDEF)-like protein
VIDDDESVHHITNNALKNIVIEGRRLELISAMSAKEARLKLEEHTDIAMALVDVIMETPMAGLELVDYIRKELNNNLIRLIIRTGQPSEAPEREVIERYDINDYKEKTELTVDKLYTTIRSSIKQYIQLIELAHKYEDVYKQMTTHPLTKLPNRQKLNEMLDSEGAKNLVLINIDGFSMINETQGFDVGDELLMQMGAFLYSMYSEEMHVFHLEADTFGVLCTKREMREERLLSIQTDVNMVNFLLGGIEKRLSITMGLAIHEEGNLIQKAEFALKDARSMGRNRASTYSKDSKIVKTIQHNSIWIQRVREALQSEKILSYYQPIFSLQSGEIVKYETLVRLSFEDEIIAPAEFLSCAKTSGQLYQIFKIMFENACQKTKEFSGQITVNMTDLDLQEPSLMEFIEETMERYGTNPAQLGIEILEEKSIMNNELAHERIVALAERGLSIIIDDFGAQCSNFGQLTNLPIAALKIDGSFIRDLDSNPKHRIITESIVEFANKMNIPTVAEFVHSKEIFDIVSKMGISYAQGFHLGKPLLNLGK